MNWAVETPLRVDQDVFASIVETKTSVHKFGSGVAVDGEKRPVLFLLVRGGEVTAIDTRGKRLAAEDVEALFPNAIRRLFALISELQQSPENN